MADRLANESPRLAPVTVDRILLGVSALVWLALLGASVAAVVALADLGRGFHKSADEPHTGLLYVVIGISALIIVVAIPVLMYARAAQDGSGADRSSRQRAGGALLGGGYSAPRGRVASRRAAEASAGPPAEALDRIWLRGTTGLASAMGAALTAVAVATYLMALDKDAAAWTGYAVAGVLTAAMPVVTWLHLRQLRILVEDSTRQRG